MDGLWLRHQNSEDADEFSDRKVYCKYRTPLSARNLWLNCVCVNIFKASRIFRLNPTRYRSRINLLKPTGYVMHQQFNIQQLYALPTP
jgi:hypothetical protein